jgi:hypothetical protein
LFPFSTNLILRIVPYHKQISWDRNRRTAST